VPCQSAEQLPGFQGPEKEVVRKQQRVAFLPGAIHHFTGQHGGVDVRAFEPLVPIPFVIEDPAVEIFFPQWRAPINAQAVETEGVQLQPRGETKTLQDVRFLLAG
jgi:hypothetical protein